MRPRRGGSPTGYCGTDTHKVDDVRYSDRLLAMAGPRPIEAARPRPDRLVARATHRRGGGRSGPARPGRARTTADGLSTPHITCGVLIPCWSCFSSPAINVYSRDVVRLVTFYEGLGFRETFRTPKDGTPDHVELVLDGFTIGIASVEAAIADHGLNPNLGGRPVEIVLWTDDTDGDYARLIADGAPSLSTPHDWLSDLRLAWVADPDGNPIQLAQHRKRDLNA